MLDKSHRAPSMTYLLLVSLTSSLCTPLPGSFALLQTQEYFLSPMLEQKPLANAVSPTVLQSNGIHSLLTPVTIQSCHGLRTALKTRLYKQYYKPDFSITSRISVLQAGSLVGEIRRYRNDHYHHYSDSLDAYTSNY